MIQIPCTLLRVAAWGHICRRQPCKTGRGSHKSGSAWSKMAARRSDRRSDMFLSVRLHCKGSQMEAWGPSRSGMILWGGQSSIRVVLRRMPHNHQLLGRNTRLSCLLWWSSVAEAPISCQQKRDASKTPDLMGSFQCPPLTHRPRGEVLREPFQQMDWHAMYSLGNCRCPRWNQLLGRCRNLCHFPKCHQLSRVHLCYLRQQLNIKKNISQNFITILWYRFLKNKITCRNL